MVEDIEDIKKTQKELESHLSKLEGKKIKKEDEGELKKLIKQNLDKNREIKNKLERLTSVIEEAAQESEEPDESSNELLKTIAKSQSALLNEVESIQQGEKEIHDEELKEKIDEINKAIHHLPQDKKISSFKEELNALDESIKGISEKIEKTDEDPEEHETRLNVL
ncbi:MAG: hypothetical protein ACOCTT_01740, partial [archaeon]